jgi:hypothetical protein
VSRIQERYREAQGVSGPMVYAAAYCPMSFKPELEDIGFDGKL